MQSSRPLMNEDDDDDDSATDLEIGEKSSPISFRTKFYRNFLAPLGTFLWSLFGALLPSFIQSTQNNETASSNSTRSDALSYLTGIRGFASIVVFIYHWTHGSYHDTMDHAYGDNSSNNHILQLPILKIIYAAEAMVAIFFLVSGYVLSYRLIKQMHAGTPLTNLSSLVLRRGPRLFLPALAATLLAFLFQIIGVMRVSESESAFGTLVVFLRRLCIDGVWTWDTIPGPGWGLHPHLWTIPTEWRCSMVLFILLLSLAQQSSLVRLVLEVGFVLWCMVAGRWDVALYAAGAVLAELRVRREEGDAPKSNHVTVWLKFVGLGIMLFVGLLFASYPTKSPTSSTPLYGPLAVLGNGDPEARRVFYTIGAVMVLGALDNLPVVQKPFKSRVALYFGKISFALYLVHGLLIRVVGQRLLDMVWSVTGSVESDWEFGVKFGLASVLFLPIVLWAADLFERGVERNIMVWVKKIS